MKDLLVFLAGVFAGWVNVLAGGGSFITLPALTYSGLGIDVANGTNRLAVLLQNVVAVLRFKRSKLLQLKKALMVSVPLLIGAILGSSVAVSLPKEILKRIVGGLLLIILVLTLKNRRALIEESVPSASVFLRTLALFFVGIYGGFIQAGVGFFLIYILVKLEGMDVVHANAYKVFSIMMYTFIVLIIFIIAKKFDLRRGIALTIGSMMGAYLATALAVKKGAKWVRTIVILALATSSVLFIIGI